VQQLLVQGIFVRIVAAVSAGLWQKVVTTLAAALLFGAVHLPDMRLTAATCVLGAVFTMIFLRWRNLWPLGLWHGWLACSFTIGYWSATHGVKCSAAADDWAGRIQFTPLSDAPVRLAHLETGFHFATTGSAG
jgi:hypothetical protein